MCVICFGSVGRLDWSYQLRRVRVRARVIVDREEDAEEEPEEGIEACPLLVLLHLQIHVVEQILLVRGEAEGHFVSRVARPSPSQVQLLEQPHLGGGNEAKVLQGSVRGRVVGTCDGAS